MPLFSFYCRDDEVHGAQRRAETRPAHLDWIGRLGERVRMAGPLISEDGRMIGSLCLIEAGSLEDARLLAKEDPYARAGVFADVQITETKWVLGAGKPE